MKVLVCTNMWPSESRPAFGPWVKEQVEDLERIGVEVDVLYIRGSESRLNYARAVRHVRRRIADKPYDLIHAHYGLVGAVALAQRRVPVVTTLHGSETGYVPWQTRVSRAVARLTEPIFVSRDAAVRFGLPEAHVIPVGVDVELFAPVDRVEARKGLGWEEDARYVLLPGSRANRRKGIGLFDASIDAVRREAPDVRPVSFTNHTRREAALVLNAVDVVLMTSEFEGAPATVKEALSSLTPVVSVAVGDVPDVIYGLPACAIVDRDADRLARAVLAALDAPRDAALRLRAEQFARPLIAERVREVYDDVVNGSRSRRPAATTAGDGR